MPAHRILIVEDELILAIDLEARLLDMGYTVVGMADSGAAAVVAAAQHQPDLILMDVRLSGAMDGIAAAGEIHRNQATPVLFMTAYADAETLRRGLAASPHGFLSKLSNDPDIREAIETALARPQG